MIRRTLWMALAALVLGIGMMATPSSAVKGCAPAKNGIKGCKNEVAACVTSDCAGLTKRALRQCKAKCKRDTKTACKAAPTICTGSPSGAFLQ
jgi:hypothetical protein